MRAVTAAGDEIFHGWVGALEARHLERCSFSEVRRALQALSSLYVERRRKLSSGGALAGHGKRAAFALFYGPLHFLIVREIVRRLGLGGTGRGSAGRATVRRVIDLGCGTGAAGAAWSLEHEPALPVEGIDVSPWAIGEAGWTWQVLGVRGRGRRGRLERAASEAGRGDAVLVAWAVNELDEDARAALLPALLAAADAGARVLVVEPIARGAAPWWASWARAFRAVGGRADDWAFSLALPEIVERLDRAAGLDHQVLKARSLSL